MQEQFNRSFQRKYHNENHIEAQVRMASGNEKVEHNSRESNENEDICEVSQISAHNRHIVPNGLPEGEQNANFKKHNEPAKPEHEPRNISLRFFFLFRHRLITKRVIFWAKKPGLFQPIKLNIIQSR